MKTKFLLFLVVSIIFFSVSCKKDEKTNIKSGVTNISYGISFGECMGYCRNQMEIEQTKVTLISLSWDTVNYPKIQCQKYISTEKWNELESLVNSISFNSLDSVYGCPDCADGGAEWVEITTSDWKHKVTVEYMSDQPAVLKNLLDSLRELKAILKECE